MEFPLVDELLMLLKERRKIKVKAAAKHFFGIDWRTYIDDVCKAARILQTMEEIKVKQGWFSSGRDGITPGSTLKRKRKK